MESHLDREPGSSSADLQLLKRQRFRRLVGVLDTLVSGTSHEEPVSCSLEGLQGLLANLVQEIEEASDTLNTAGLSQVLRSTAPALPKGKSGATPGVRHPLTEALQKEPPPAQVASPEAGVSLPGSPLDTSEETARRKIEILRSLFQKVNPVFKPTLDARAPKRHACPEVDTHFSLSPGEGLRVLEELADSGLLQRQLLNRIHLCPQCERCHLNYREHCPGCMSIDLKRESLVHHSRCGYTGLQSEFESDHSLNCPKCRQELSQSGQDFERPKDTYVCGTCSNQFDESCLRVQCLDCGNDVHPSETREAKIFAYRPTPLAVRAVQLGRLTGLEGDPVT